MNISYNWLKRYLDTDLSAEQLAVILTDIGLEVEGLEKIEGVRGGLEGVVVGEVLTCEDHPDSDHLHITRVDVGEGEPLPIVCGAANCRQGLKVLCAKVGAVLYPDGAEQEFRIKRSKIRGVESLGMLCAEDELGVGVSHDGIMELPADAVPGTPARDFLGIEDDYLIVIGLTPNRIDAASHIGVARDVAAYLKSKGLPGGVRMPDVSAFTVDDHALEIGVTVECPEAAPRYAGVTVTAAGSVRRPNGCSAACGPPASIRRTTWWISPISYCSSWDNPCMRSTPGRSGADGSSCALASRARRSRRSTGWNAASRPTT